MSSLNAENLVHLTYTILTMTSLPPCIKLSVGIPVSFLLCLDIVLLIYVSLREIHKDHENNINIMLISITSADVIWWESCTIGINMTLHTVFTFLKLATRSYRNNRRQRTLEYQVMKQQDLSNGPGVRIITLTDCQIYRT